MPKLNCNLFIFFFFLIFIPGQLHAQQGELTVNVQIKVLELSVNELGRRVDPVFKFRLNNENGELMNAGGVCYTFHTKPGITSLPLPSPDIKYAGWEKLKVIPIPILSRPTITLYMECYTDEKGEVCNFDKKDEHHAFAKKVINLNDYVPGDQTDTILLSAVAADDQQEHFRSKVELRYSLIAPDHLRSTLEADINPVNKSFELSSSYQLANRSRLLFNWEFSKDRGLSWRTLPTSGESQLHISIDPLKDLFNNRLTTTEQVQFRLKVNSRDTTMISDTLITYFTAPAPVFAKEDVHIENTCKGMNSGVLVIENIQSATRKVSYVLRRSSSNHTACDLKNTTPEGCPGFITAGTAVNGMIELKNLPQDESYNLLLYNTGLDVGENYTSHDFSIGSYPELAFENVFFRNPTCTDDHGGQINFKLEGGGKREAWQIEITPAFAMEADNNDYRFKSLPEGTYVVDVTDGCGVQQTKTFVLKKPEKLEIESIKVQRKPELALIVRLKNGSGRYRATISTRDGYIKPIDSLINNIIPIQSTGIFQIRILDKIDPDCLHVDTTFSVEDINAQPSKKGVDKKTVWTKPKKGKPGTQDENISSLAIFISRRMQAGISVFIVRNNYTILV
jgi:hypothetical protein